MDTRVLIKRKGNWDLCFEDESFYEGSFDFVDSIMRTKAYLSFYLRIWLLDWIRIKLKGNFC